MNEYDQQYYFIRHAKNDSLPDLTPNANTEDRTFRFEEQPAGSAPLFFYDGGRDYAKKLGIPRMETPPDILFEGQNLDVCSRIRMDLLQIDIPNLHMHPVVYIHDDGKWHEDYWYMTFSKEFDCWDRSASEHGDEPLEMGGFTLYSVYQYSLDKELLDKTPPKHRLLFKMGGSLDAFIVCHESIRNIFLSGTGQNGARLQLISEY